jgi:hypothetical protein
MPERMSPLLIQLGRVLHAREKLVAVVPLARYYVAKASSSRPRPIIGGARSRNGDLGEHYRLVRATYDRSKCRKRRSGSFKFDTNLAYASPPYDKDKETGHLKKTGRSYL